jgi:acyl dehydratase
MQKSPSGIESGDAGAGSAAGTMAPRFLDDFRPGEVFSGGPRTIGERDLLYCTLWCGDGQPHSNEEYSRKSPFGARIVHGDAMFAAGAGLIHRQGLFTSTMTGIEALELKFPAPVRVGDAIGARLTIKTVDSRPERPTGAVGAVLHVINETLGVTSIIAEILYSVKRRPHA